VVARRLVPPPAQVDATFLAGSVTCIDEHAVHGGIRCTRTRLGGSAATDGPTATSDLDLTDVVARDQGRSRCRSSRPAGPVTIVAECRLADALS
jgi:hypothetical protein